MSRTGIRIIVSAMAVVVTFTAAWVNVVMIEHVEPQRQLA